MATGSGVWVFYFLQGENGESEDTPNTFKDLSDPNSVLPRYDNVICAKVLRLDRLPKPRASRLRRKAPPTGVPGSRASFGRRVPSRPVEVAQDVGHGHGHGHGSWPGPNRARSASPAAPHHHDPNEIQGDIRREKSAGSPPPNNHIGGGRIPGTGGRVSPPAGVPPQSAAQENLEAFLSSDSPVSSPRVGTAASPGGGVGKGFGRGEHTNFDAKLKQMGKTRAGTADNADLLNFENDAAGPAPGARRRATGASLGGGSHGGGSSQRPWHVSSGGGLKQPNARAPPPASAATGQGSSANARQRNSGPSRPSPEGVSAGAAPGTANGTAGGRRMSHPTRPSASVGGGGSGGGGTEAAAAAESRSASPGGDVDGREQQIRDGAEAAKQAIKERDRAAAQDQEDMDAANQRFGAVLTAWAEDHGQKKNVRTLLSTMHTVLWEGHQWRPVDMADLIQPSGVKKAYRKAMLLVHPDKCRYLGPEQRFIAKRVFEAVNEAYTIFADKEML